MTGRGRSIPIYERLYMDGCDLSGYTIDCGERGVDYAEAGALCLSDVITGYLPGRPTVTFGPVNGVYDYTDYGLSDEAGYSQGIMAYVMHVRGVNGNPAIGDDVFAAPLILAQYKASSGPIVNAKMTFGGLDTSFGLNYDEFFGALLHPWGSETGANAANTNADNGAASSAGGWLMYHVYSIAGGAGTATISVDDSANGTDWLALSGATSGAIAYNAVPGSGIVQLATNATVRRYLRWQLALAGGATSALFTLAFMRGR